MAKCMKCGEPIIWKEHPQNKTKMAPFNEDGVIHFATCRAKKDDQRAYDRIDDIEGSCGHGRRAKYVHYQRISNGRLVIVASCDCSGEPTHKITTLPNNEACKALINERPRKAVPYPPYTEETTVYGGSDYDSEEEARDPFATVEDLSNYNRVHYVNFSGA